MPWRSAIVVLVWIVVLTLFLAGVSTETLLYSRNVAAIHPDWVLGKRLLAPPSWGATSASATRQLLSRNRLNLDAWHGFHEVLFARVFRPGRVRWRFQVADRGHVHAILNRDADGFTGLRLSRNPRLPSLYYHALESGEFLDAHELPSAALDGSPHDAEWRFEGAELVLSLDGSPIARVPERPVREQVIGFRGAWEPAWIDDVEVFDGDGRRLVTEGFDNAYGRRAILAGLAGLLLASLGLGALVARRRGAEWITVASWCLMLEATALALVGSYFAFDWFYWSRTYPYHGGMMWSVGSDEPRLVEQVRQGLFERLPLPGPAVPSLAVALDPGIADFLGGHPHGREGGLNLQLACGGPGALHYEAATDSPASVEWMEREQLQRSVRVLLLGTSQTWGLGAATVEDRIATRLQARLAERFAGQAEVCILNAGRRASRAAELLERYRRDLHHLRPHIVVVNLSNNDATPGFGDRLDQIVQAAQADGADVVFVLEANCPGTGLRSLRLKHAAMRDVAARRRLAVLDLHGFLSGPEVRDSGLLWWDRVHLTSYGQARGAEFLADGLAEPVSKALARLPPRGP